jgi:Flp pilus assembly protein TadB
MTEIKMRTFRSGISSRWKGNEIAAALQDADFPPQRITVKQQSGDKVSVIIGGKYASAWINGKLPTATDRRRYSNVWGK